MTLIFFPVKAEMLLFSNLMTGGPRGDSQIVNFTLKSLEILKIFVDMFIFKLKFTLCKSPRGPPVIRFEKNNISAFTGKNIDVIAFLDQFLPQFKTWHRKQPKNVDTCWRTRKVLIFSFSLLDLSPYL